MKFRTDFVTNSSSSSYIVCFARIADKEKAQEVIDKYNLKVFSSDGINEERCWDGTLGADWAGAEIYGADKVMVKHPQDSYILIQERLDADYNEYCEPIYSHDFVMDKAIDSITENNGFTDIETAYGEGYDG